MKIIENWKEILLAAIIVWALVFVHPFSREGVLVTGLSEPGTSYLVDKSFVGGKYSTTDYIVSVDGVPVQTAAQFNADLKKISADDTVMVNFTRETFPYTYTEKEVAMLAVNNSNPLGIFTMDAPFSKVKFDSQLSKANKFTISTQDVDGTKAALKTRFKINSINDYLFGTDGNNLVVYTTKGAEIDRIIEATGHFEAKVGNDTLFTDSDIKSACTSGVGCVMRAYPSYNLSNGVVDTIWGEYMFELTLNKDVSAHFKELIAPMKIASCENSVCKLNGTVDYYLDGKVVGYENIYSESKEVNTTRFYVTGRADTYLDAYTEMYFVQSAISAKTDAKVIAISDSKPAYSEVIILGALGVGTLISAIAGAIVATVIKRPTAGLAVFFTNAASVAVIFGMYSGLGLVVSPAILIVATIVVPLMDSVYKIYVASASRKTDSISRVLISTNNALNKILWAVFVISCVTAIFSPVLGVPLAIYSVLSIALSKGVFYKAIRA